MKRSIVQKTFLGASFCVINIFIVFGFGHISKYLVVFIRWWYSFIKQRYGHFVYCVYIVREWGTIQAWCLNVYIIKIFYLSSLLQKMLFNKSQLLSGFQRVNCSSLLFLLLFVIPRVFDQLKGKQLLNTRHLIGRLRITLNNKAACLIFSFSV